MFAGKNLPDVIGIVGGLAPVTPSSSVPDYISLKDVDSVEVVIFGLNGTTVTGSAITLLQATAVANTGEKALAFSKYYAITDIAATSVFSEATASSNTFTTTNTNSKAFIYRIPVDPASLDTANNFDCIRAGTANGANTTIAVFYLVTPKFGGKATLMPNFIVD